MTPKTFSKIVFSIVAFFVFAINPTFAFANSISFSGSDTVVYTFPSAGSFDFVCANDSLGNSVVRYGYITSSYPSSGSFSFVANAQMALSNGIYTFYLAETGGLTGCTGGTHYALTSKEWKNGSWFEPRITPAFISATSAIGIRFSAGMASGILIVLSSILTLYISILLWKKFYNWVRRGFDSSNTAV